MVSITLWLVEGTCVVFVIISSFMYIFILLSFFGACVRCLLLACFFYFDIYKYFHFLFFVAHYIFVDSVLTSAHHSHKMDTSLPHARDVPLGSSKFAWPTQSKGMCS